MNNDQAKNLRDLMKKSQPKQDKSRDAVIYAFIGSEGSGSTTVISNLANMMSENEKKILLVDFNSGLLTTDVFFNITPERNLRKVLSVEKSEKEMLIKVKKNIYIIYGSELLDAPLDKKLLFKEKINMLKSEADMIFLDISGVRELEKVKFLLCQSNIVFISSPNSESIKETYYGIKYLKSNMELDEVDIIINKSGSIEEMEFIFEKLENTVKKFLDLKINSAGFISHDNVVKEAIKRQKLFTEIYPDSNIASEISYIEKYLQDKSENYMEV